MVHDILIKQKPHKNIYLIFGCRKFEDGLYADELKQLERELPSFRYIPTYSREESSNGEYRTGYVHSIYEEICGGEKRQGVDSPYPASFFLCGWKNGLPGDER